VTIDGRGDAVHVALLHYAPDTITAHPGDTIAYRSEFSGEPHTITFGTLVEAAIDVWEGLPAGDRAAVYTDESTPPALAAALAKVPSMRPDESGDINQAASNPCFVATGAPPLDPKEPCAVTDPPPFNGTETFYNSGFVPDGETFKLHLSDDIEPGTYRGFCTMHQTRMISTIVVVPKDQPVSTADEVKREAKEHVDLFVSALTDATKDARANPAGAPVLGGTGAITEHGLGLVIDFLPDTTAVAVGEPITWKFFGRHAIAFNAPESARTMIERTVTGFHLNTAALAPQGVTAPPTPAGWGNDPGRPSVDGGTWDGTGTLSSGSGWQSFTLRFSKPGAYPYICLIHPDMKGTVTVQ
jgi:plastocyanin